MNRIYNQYKPLILCIFHHDYEIVLGSIEILGL